ncbi:MAG: hypothetical protein DLM50_03080 [Candidatus Meridianibacter frigidus]|nr:MAG: hypothetical protein DLM50_03080 [Candidatus Eremiobacteraeota bacterium]
MTFKPRFDQLPASQRDLWPELAATVRSGFVLYGGTALTLRLGHRASIDFDFFTEEALDKRALLTDIPILSTSQVIQDTPDSFAALAPSGDQTVKLSFFGSIGFGRVGEPELTEDGVCMVASLLDLYATKLKVLLQRAESKDYRDMIALLQSGVSLEQGLAAAQALYGKQFQPAESLKAMTFFGDGDLGTLSDKERRRLIEAAMTIKSIGHMDTISQRLS